MTSHPTDTAKLAGWEVQYLRFLVFPLEPQVEKSQAWWSSHVQTDAETITKKLQREERGDYKGDKLHLTIDLLQINWTLIPDVGLFENPLPPVLMGGYDQARDRFVDLISRWLPECPPIKRMAFHAKLLKYVDKTSDIVPLLNKYLARSCKTESGTSDFLYRINRPRKVETLNNLVVNRLSTWGAVKFMLSIQAVGATSATVHHSLTEGWPACSLELDINTDQDKQNAIEPDLRLSVAKELVNCANEIAENGDIP